MVSDDLHTPNATDGFALFQPSLFALLRDELDQAVPIVQCTKATLVHLSHTLEDLVLSHNLPALMFTGFQESSYWRQETERYRALAAVAQQVCIFAGGELPPESSAKELHITLRGDDPLRQEWFVAILAPEFAVVLCGQDQAVAVDDEALRRFDTIWTFEPELVNRVLDKLEAVIEVYRPERLEPLREARGRFPPTQPNARLMTKFAVEMIRYEEQIQRSLYQKNRTIDSQLRWREQLTEMLVHDLRTPLQSVLMALDLLRAQPDGNGAAMQSTITLALRGATSITSMVNLILDTNRLEAHQFQVQWQHLRLAEVVHEALEPLRPQILHDRVTLHVELESELSVCWGDRDLLVRVVQNVLSNASKFTRAGGTISITTQRSSHPDAIDLLVNDTGEGISPEALLHIFDRHYQVERGDRRGLGIGLYFCRLAMEAQEGSISAASSPGAGATFIITIRTALPDAALSGDVLIW